MLQVYKVVIKKCCYKISNYYNSNKASPSTRMQNTPYISNYFFLSCVSGMSLVFGPCHKVLCSSTTNLGS